MPLSTYRHLIPREMTMLPVTEQALIEHISLRRQDYLIREGEFGSIDLFYVLSGVCVNDLLVRLGNTPFDSRKILPGEFIGLQELVSVKPRRRESTVLAKTSVEALRIPGKDFLRWQVEYPEFYNFVISSVLDTHFDLRAMSAICAAKDTVKGGAFYMHYLYGVYLKGCCPPDYEGAVRIWDTRQEIAQALNRDVRSVDRMLKELREQNLVGGPKGKITIDKEQAAGLAAYGDNQ